jgi:hypothetical protein
MSDHVKVESFCKRTQLLVSHCHSGVQLMATKHIPDRQCCSKIHQDFWDVRLCRRLSTAQRLLNRSALIYRGNSNMLNCLTLKVKAPHSFEALRSIAQRNISED